MKNNRLEQEKRNRGKTRAVAIPLNLLIAAGVFFWLIFFYCRFAFGDGAMHPYANLEQKVWKSEIQELPDVERQVVRLLQIDPYSAKAHYLLSHVMLRFYSYDPSDLQLLKQASELSEQAIDLDWEDDSGYIALANILDLMGQTTKGLALLDQAVSNGIKVSWRLPFTKARLLADGQDDEIVLKYLKTAIDMKDSAEDIIIPYIIAVLQSSKQNNEELIATLEEWNKKYPHLYFQQSLALNYVNVAKYKEAHIIYGNIQRDFPNDNKEAKINDAVILYKYLNKSKEAILLLENVLLNLDSGSYADSSLIALIHLHLGAVQLKLNNFVMANNNFFQAYKASSDQLSVIDFIANCYKEANQPRFFVSLLQSLNEKIVGSPVLFALLGETLSEKLKEHNKAIIAYNNAIILSPGKSDYYIGLGIVYYRQKNYDEAFKFFSIASVMDPTDAIAHYNIACLLAIRGKKAEAFKALQEAFLLDPKLIETAKTDVDLAGIKEEETFKQLVNAPLKEMDDKPGFDDEMIESGVDAAH